MEGKESKSSEKKQAGTDQGKEIAGRLKAQLQLLEKEYKSLKKELDARKESRQKDPFVNRSEEYHERMKRLDEEIQVTGESARVQNDAIQDIKGAFDRVEKRFQGLMGRLDRMEKSRTGENEYDPDLDPERLKAELLGLLGDVKEIKEKRVRLMDGLKRPGS